MVAGFLTGFAFGILLYGAGLTSYDVVEGQLLLADFTFGKVLFSALLVSVIGFSLLRRAGLVQVRVMQPFLGTHITGGLIMGAGFALLGYGPATVLGASATGSWDALAGGMLGILFGAGFYAGYVYPRIRGRIQDYGKIPASTLPELCGVKSGIMVIAISAFIVLVLWSLGNAGL